MSQSLIYISNSTQTRKAHGLQIAKMCEAFANQGLKVELVLPDRARNLDRGDFFDFYGVKPNFALTKLPVKDMVWLGRPGFVLTALAFGRAVRKYLASKNAGIIYTRDPFSLLFLKSMPAVFEAHGLSANPILIKAIKSAVKIVAITESLASRLVDLGVDRSKILVAPDGVDLGQFNLIIDKLDARRQLGLPVDKKIVLFSGNRNFPWKGSRVVVKAAKSFGPDVIFVFLGLGKSNFDPSNILNRGFRPYQEMPLWLKAADVLLLPNTSKLKVSRLYTSPLKMFEYMTAQRPIVASSIPAIREILDENNAILVEPDDDQTLARGVSLALTDDRLSRAISKKAFEDVQNFTWQKRAARILNFVSKTVNLEL